MGKARARRPGQSAVRANVLDRALEGMNREMGEKSTRLLVNYHQTFIAPIEERLRHLEKPFYRRWPIDVGRMILRTWVKLTFLLSWRITDEDFEKGWQRKRYQGIGKALDDVNGFLFVLKPFHLLVRVHTGWLKFKQLRQERREAAELAAKEAAEAEEPTEEPVADEA